ALNEEANRSAVAFARQVLDAAPPGVLEVAPNLVSVLLKYDPVKTGFEALAGALRLLIGGGVGAEDVPASHTIGVRFDGDDLDAVAGALNLPRDAFVATHCASPLRVLATGFAPGFVYCGFHGEALAVPRRQQVRRM